MKDYIKTAAYVGMAFVVYSFFMKISTDLITLINIFSIVVIVTSLKKGEIYSAATGMFCGLIHDAFSLGVFGVAGISKTILGFTASYISKKINVAPLIRKFIFVSVLLSFELILWSFLYVFLFSERINLKGGLIFLQPFCTALIISILFPLGRSIKLKMRNRKLK